MNDYLDLIVTFLCDTISDWIVDGFAWNLFMK